MTGCSSLDETIPGINIPINSMNKNIVLLDPPGLENQYKNNSISELQIKNLSDQSYVFSGDFGVRLFMKQNNKWIPVKDNIRSPSGEYLLPPNYPPGRIIPIIPNIDSMNGPTVIRVFVIGHKEKSTNELVGAFLDLKIYP